MARSRIVPAPPRVSEPDLPARLEDGEQLRPGSDLQQARWTHVAGHADASHAAIAECRFEDVAADELVLADAQLVDVDIAVSRATLIRGRGSRWRRVHLHGGRIATLDLADADLDEVRLEGLRIDYLSLAGSRVVDLIAEDCTFGAVDLPQAELTRVSFEGCRADEIDTRSLRCTDVDLRGLDADAVIDVTGLRGATLSTAQAARAAVALAAGLGIDVRD